MADSPNASLSSSPFAAPQAMTSLHTLPSTARSVLIAVNPNAGACSRLPIAMSLADELVASGLHAEVVTEIPTLIEVGHRLHQSGDLRAIVAAGGDGTVGLILNQLPAGVPVAILPLGTENLLAKYLGAEADPQRLSRQIVEGYAVRFDAGMAGDRLFSLMAGCGFDADVVRRLHESRKGHIQHLSYAKPILDAICNYDYPQLTVYYAPEGAPDDAPLTERIEACWVFVANLPRYAAGLCFAPDATASDGLLDVCTFREGSLWNGLMYLGGVVLGQHRAMNDCTSVQTRRLRVECDVPVPVQLDGDPAGHLPLEFSSQPGRMTLIVDRDWAEKNGY